MGGGGGQRAANTNGPPDAETLAFSKNVLGTTEEVWKEEFRKQGKTYKAPHMELFSDSVRTGCGNAITRRLTSGGHKIN